MIVDELIADLVAERDDLDALLATLPAKDWSRGTPSPGWSVLDQVTHLAQFDDAARRAIAEPDEFRATRGDVMVDIDAYVDLVARSNRWRSGSGAIEWLRECQDGLVDAASRADPAVRIPWYGPDMSVASSLTARIMETWAHCQDIADTFGVIRVPSERLRHVAFLGWRAIPNSFRARGRPVPDEDIRVELGEWTFGAEGAANRVSGTALDFSLVVTQRRHPDDTGLVAQGEVAAEWLAIAQAFAGPPGAGRQPGQFRT